ncbi:putative ctf8 [Lyophyllum shimeji]|uniref:Ctf8 n=1 Tax=Lyophyllum shimeji TaxID=47721 RepID=A0A9P3PPG6_LYOSH|nr:putative ctf8 [Lyophyllum shimeji]
MIVPINVATSSSNPKLPPGLAKISDDEVVLIELQGSLDVECNQISERNGKFVGKLKVDASTNKPTLLIGHHLLEGKIASLSRPLAVLLRSGAASTTPAASTARTDIDGDGDDVEMMDFDQRTLESGKTTEWDMVAIVKRKIVFAKRPMPVVNLNGHHET